MKTKTKLVFVLVMIATLIISLAVYKIQKDDFKDNFSNVELKQSKEFENDLNGILKSYLQSNDYVDKKDIPKCLSEVYDFCRSHTDVIKLYEYDSKNESVYIELKSGMTYLIIPPVEDRLSGKGSGEIVTFEPNKKSIQNFLAKSLMKIGGMEYRSVKDTAYFINEQCESFNFDSSFENKEVSIDNLKNLSSFKLMLWNGHGGYNEKKDILALATATKTSRGRDKDYSKDIREGRIIKMGFVDKEYGITSNFIDKYFPEMKNSIIYLGTCYSCINSSLSDSFFKKGAVAILGYDVSIEPDVEVQIRTLLFSDLCERLTDKNYRTVREAYDLRVGDYTENGFVLRVSDNNVRLIETTVAEKISTPIKMTDFIGMTVDKLCEIYGTDFAVGYDDGTMDGSSTTRKIYYEDNRIPLEFTVSAKGLHANEPSISEITGGEIIYNVKMLKPSLKEQVDVNETLTTNTTYSQLNGIDGTRYIYDLKGPFYEEGFVYSIEDKNAFIELYCNEFPDKSSIPDKIIVHGKEMEYKMPDDNWGVRTVVDFTTDSNVSPFTVTGVVKTIKREHPGNGNTINCTVIYLDKPIKQISNNFGEQEVKYVGLYIDKDMQQYGVLQYPKDGTRVTVTGEAWEGHTAYHQNMMITAILIREY